MPTLKNPVHEKFAQLFAPGESSAAFVYKTLHPRVSNKAAETHGPRMARLPKVAKRCQELRDKANKRLEDDVVFEIEDAMRFCVEVINTPIMECTSSSRLTQEFEEKEFGVRIKMPSKLDALDKLAKLKGWYAAEQINIKGLDPTISEAVAKRFKRKA